MTQQNHNPNTIQSISPNCYATNCYALIATYLIVTILIKYQNWIGPATVQKINAHKFQNKINIQMKIILTFEKNFVTRKKARNNGKQITLDGCLDLLKNRCDRANL